MSQSTSQSASLSHPSTIIPASRRPDGTLRKEIRVKPGFVPQEEQKLYVNARVEAVAAAKGVIPGMPKAQKREVEGSGHKGKGFSQSRAIGSCSKTAQAVVEPRPKSHRAPLPPAEEASDPVKKLRNLRKKLGQIEELEAHQQEKPDFPLLPPQLAKLASKAQVEAQIKDLERTLAA